MNAQGGNFAIASQPVDGSEQLARDWFTATELAELALPGLPADKRAINRRARDERWHLRSGSDGNPRVRPRAGRGGGVEFHVSLLPGAARIALDQRTPASLPNPANEAVAGGWRWYESQSATTRAEAEHRLAVCREIDLLEQSGMTRTAAVADTAERRAIGKATLWTWLRLINGVPPRDWLPALAPRRQGGGCEAEIDSALWTIFKSDYLRPSEPTLTSCYERTAAIAAERGLSLPSEKTMRRRLIAEVDARIILYRRKGEEALRRSIPAQRRTVEHLHAMECVNIDGHKFDVFVTPPDGGKPIRPMMVALQDIRSSKIVAWRLGETESTTLARLAIADMIRDVGIPKRLTTDNGRAFASKFFTGGTTTRFRGKILESDPTGLLVALGIDIDWALPYRGQSKPIERAFRDLCDTISRAPACDGAYTGPNPQQKPENYGKRAVPWDEFNAHVAQGIARHNARLGRTGRDYRGRSFDQVFAETFVEIGNAKQRLALNDKLLKDQVGSIQNLIDELTTGSLFEGSVIDQRTALLGKIDAARADANAGVEGAADKLAGLLEKLNSVSRDAFATTAGFAADRQLILDVSRDVIAKNNQRVADAQKASDPALQKTNDLLNEQAAQNAELVSQGQEQTDLLKKIAGSVGGSGVDLDSLRRAAGF